MAIDENMIHGANFLSKITSKLFGSSRSTRDGGGEHIGKSGTNL
jgi:hypothetical protein